MSGNNTRSPSDTALSIPSSDTAELGFDVVKATGRLPAPTYIPGKSPDDAVQAPGAIDTDEPLHPTVIPPPKDRSGDASQFQMAMRLGTAHQVSATMDGVDATHGDMAFDAQAFEREPLSMRSASCAAFSTTLDDATIQHILRSTQTFRKVSTSAKGTVWMYSCSGERSPVPTSEIYHAVRVASLSRDLPEPSVMFMHYGKQQDTSSILDTFEREAGSGFPLLTERPVFVGDEAFKSAVEHPRVKVYVGGEIAAQPRAWLGRRFYAMNLQPAINSIRAGGAEKQYGREGEEKQIRAWVDSTLRSGKYSSLTIHGDPMMGKTRMAAEIVRYVQQNYPGTTLVFAPAMDTHKSDPFHYAKAFTKRLVEGFSERPDITKTLVYQQLLDFVHGTAEDMSPNALSTLLVSFFQLLPSSSAKLLLVPDDMQWPDTESNAFLTKIFSQHVTFGNMAVLNLTRTGDEVMSPALLSAMQSRDSDSISLKPLAFLDKNGEPTKMLSAFVADLLHVPEFDVPAGKEYLRRLAKIAQGNPGVLTEVVRSMQQEGVIAVKGGERLTIDHTRFMAWTEAGEADNIVVTKVDRLLQNEQYREVLVHLVAFRESGGCDADLFLKFLTNVLKKPELANAFTKLANQQTIELQQMGDRGDTTLSFSQELVGARLKKVFTEEGSSYGPQYQEAHRVIARFMFDMQMKAGRGGNPHMASILERCNPRAIVTHAAASGSLPKLAEGYAIQAITEAYKVGDHAATLEIYKSIVQSNPALRAEIEKDEKLQLSILHSMTVLRAEWGEMAIALGDNLKKKYLKLLNASEQYDEALISRIDHLYDLMCTFYFMRGTARKLRDESVLKLAEWASGYGKNLLFNARNDIRLRQGMFFDIKESFYLMLAEYMQQRYAQACEMYGSQFEMRCVNLSREFPGAEKDPRFQKLNLEATRLGANGWLMGFNRAEIPGLEGVAFAYDDEESCMVSSRDPQSSMHQHLVHAEELFRSYLAQATDAPDQVMDRTQVYRAKQAFARTLGMLGKYYESLEQFLDARSDAHRYGDPERFADITDGATSMLSNMAKHFLADPDNREFQEMIMSIASLIRRSEQGEAPGDQDVFSSLQYILKKAHQYSEQAARITADISHSSNFDTAMVNILDIIETMVNSHSAFNKPLDPDVLLLLGEAMKRVLNPTQLLPDGKTPAPTFFERMTKLDTNGKANEYWTLYIAPCLSRLALGSTQFESEQAQDVFDPLLRKLGFNVKGYAGLLDSLHALNEERHTPTKARSPAYDQAIKAKATSVEGTMDLLEARDLVQYSFDEK
ncbi:MAG: AAA family ATPase [Candidatus Peregrinibacteria bacterium]|nr:AAA family ATPase [Candidatus Peregrinibacteria bacterium]